MVSGNLDICNKLILAPMAGITDTPFRKVAKEHGAYLTFTQMISAKGILENNFDTLRFIAFNKSEKPIGIQLLGNDPGIVGEAVSQIVRYKPDWIDLNIGCPVNKVTKHNMGAGLMDQPELIGKLVKAMKDNAGTIPISIKTRLGSDAKNITVIRNAKVAEDNGVDAVIVHCRTSKDPYIKAPDISWLKKVKESVNVKVIGNGSIFTSNDAFNMINSTGCDSVLIARGAIGNPFIFSNFKKLTDGISDIERPGVEQMIEVLKRHIKYLVAEYGPFNSINIIKKNIFWYFRFYNGIDKLVSIILPQNNLDDILATIEEHSQNIVLGKFNSNDAVNAMENFYDRIVFWKRETTPNIYQFMY